MIFGEILSVALGALRANKLRSLLTMLGIVIGVAAVITVVAMGTGAREAVNQRIAALGTTLLTVVPVEAHERGVASTANQAKLTLDDAQTIRQNVPLVTAVQPEMSRRLQVQYLNQNTTSDITGTSPNYLTVRKFSLQAGRMFTEADDRARRRVAVLGPTAAENLGAQVPAELIGKSIRIRGIQFDIIGVLTPKGQGAGWFNPDDQILIPINTARFRVMGTDRLRSINVLARSEAEIPQATVELQRVLRRAHRLRPGQPDDFQLRNQSDFVQTFAETTQVFSVLLAGIASVSLLVGGIGIMNIMLVSVTERTREIGVRKALGATRRNILLQFLIEAVVLCLLGGVLGIVLGAGGAIVLNKGFAWNTAVAPSSIGLAFLFSAAVGILFGVWPARRAAQLDPIAALRYE